MKIAGTKATTVILRCDQWRPRRQWDLRYPWMPLEIGDGNLRMPPRPWSIDVVTGESAIVGEDDTEAPAP